jgi:hypothetical protein
LPLKRKYKNIAGGVPRFPVNLPLFGFCVIHFVIQFGYAVRRPTEKG